MPKRATDLSALPRNFLRCRDEGHSWYDPRRKTTTHERVGNHVERRSVCSSCDTRKAQLFTPTGKVVTAPVYYYPDGYLIVTGGKRTTRTDVRKLTLRVAFSVLKKRSA